MRQSNHTVLDALRDLDEWSAGQNVPDDDDDVGVVPRTQDPVESVGVQPRGG